MRKATYAFGRRCYDHLGGKLGALLLDLYLSEGYVKSDLKNPREYQLTPKGKNLLLELGVPEEKIHELISPSNSSI